MIGNAKGLSLTIVVFATSFGAANFAIKSAFQRRAPIATASYATSAAFRDGIYQAKLDRESRRPQHLMSGRWRTDEDRRLFVLGYLQSYAQWSGNAAIPTSGPQDIADARAYFEGLKEGMQDRRAFAPFRSQRSANVGRTAQVSTTAAVSEHQALSNRAAYNNGYQQGYYAAQ